MIRIYIKDNKIVKSVNTPYMDTHAWPIWATFIDSPFLITDHLVYEGWEIIPYKDSQEMIDEKATLEAIQERNEFEQMKLDYILSLS